MKSILETSLYLLIAALICYIGIDFVSANMRVSQVNEVSQYLKDYIEIYGSAEPVPDGSYLLDSATLAAVSEKAAKSNMTVTYQYTAATREHIYYDLYVEYDLQMAVLGIQRKHICSSLVRVAV